MRHRTTRGDGLFTLETRWCVRRDGAETIATEIHPVSGQRKQLRHFWPREDMVFLGVELDGLHALVVDLMDKALLERLPGGALA